MVFVDSKQHNMGVTQ